MRKLKNKASNLQLVKESEVQAMAVIELYKARNGKHLFELITDIINREYANNRNWNLSMRPLMSITIHKAELLFTKYANGIYSS